jgi:hypothetical protein
VEVFISGVENGVPVRGQGRLKVELRTGVKSGRIRFWPRPKRYKVDHHSTMPMETGRCFVGGKHVGGRAFVGPLELLGREFVSVRDTQMGRYGSASVSESARRVGDALRCEFASASTIKLPKVVGLGPLREVITVTGADTLVGEGRYTFLTSRGRPIPVRYTHFYRSLRPHRSFRRLQGRSFLLRAKISTRVRGNTLYYRSVSTIRVVNGP